MSPKRPFTYISELLCEPTDFDKESNLLDLVIHCQDGKFVWSKFLLAASSKFLWETLSSVQGTEPVLLLPQFKRELVQSFLWKSVTEPAELQSDDETDLGIYQILGFHCSPSVKVLQRPEKGLVCSEHNCAQVFQRQRDLYRHMSTKHSKENRFVCDQCGKVFFHLDNLNLHIRYHQDLQRIHRCSYCQGEFRGYRALQTHIEDHHTSPVPCPVCQKMFKKRRLLRHMRAKHGEDSGKRDHQKRTFKKIKPKNVPEKDAIDELIEGQNKRVKCSSCDQTFANRYIAKYHHQKVHLKLQKGTTLSCSVCEKKFVGPPSRLARHMREVHAENRFECSQCGHFFPVRASLERHLATVHHPQKLECPFCPVSVVHMSAHLISTHGMTPIEARHVAAELSGKFAARTNLPYAKS